MGVLSGVLGPGNMRMTIFSAMLCPHAGMYFVPGKSEQRYAITIDLSRLCTCAPLIASYYS